MVLGTSQCDGCGKTIKKGELFALMGDYPGFGKRFLFGPAGGLDQFGNCFLLCDKCFKAKFQERKK